MNRGKTENYAARTSTASSLRLLVLVFVCGGGDLFAQSVADYAAEPPLIADDGGGPSGHISTIAAAEPSGAGALYQAAYYRSYTDADTGDTINWSGTLSALFMDEAGRFREDNGVKGKLEDTSIDYVVDIFTDTSVSPSQTRFRRFQQTGSGPGASLNAVGAAAEMDTLGTIWNARDVLAAISQQDLLVQRPLAVSGSYAEDAAGKRFIFTWLDVPGEAATGEVNAGEVINFVPEVFDPALLDNWRYLGLSDQHDAMNLARYVRGQAVSGWRSRLIDLPGDGSALPRHWILGDIVNSAPLVVNPPSERYHLVNGDATYKKFRDQYAHRRQMIYVGANDGMLHAFNGGVWNAATRTFQTANFAGTGTSHGLGAEMWAYVPMNLLPHLQWLKASDYSHVYFVDGAPQAFDVNIFTDDATHPGGWGTILVTGMRFGGGPFDLDLDADGNAETLRTSAVIVMDITDPEKPPVLLAELTLPGLNFTTVTPAVIKSRRPDASGSFASPEMNRWVLMLGSGPDDLVTATSQLQKPNLFAWDLVAAKYIQLSSELQPSSFDAPGFYGSLASVDRDNDYIDDVLYAGTVEGTEQAPHGRIKRLALDAASQAFGLASGTAHLGTLIDIGKPVVARPAFIHSYANHEDWLLFGTGRSFTVSDYHSAYGEQLLVGVKDSGESGNTVERASLVDATDILVQVDTASGARKVWDGAAGSALVLGDRSIDSFQDLSVFMNDKPGWYRKLRVDQAPERVVTDVMLVRSSALFAAFLPEPDSNYRTGESVIYALNFRTGTADAMALFGLDMDGVVRNFVSIGSVELTMPALSTVVSNDPGPEQVGSEDEDDTEAAEDTEATQNGNTAGTTIISVVAGTGGGRQERVKFALPPARLKRVSWERLELPF